MKWSLLLLACLLFVPGTLAADEKPAAPRPPEDAASQQIRVHMKICELSLTKLERRGLDLAELGLAPPAPNQETTLPGKPAGPEPPLLVGNVNSKTALGLVEVLRRDGILRVWPASPQQTIADGQTAYFLCDSGIGRTAPSSLDQWFLENVKIGPQIEVMATLLNDRHIRLRVLAKRTEVDSTVSFTLRGATLPGLNIHKMLAPCEMELGTTAVVGGLIQPDIQPAVDPQTYKKSDVRNDLLMLLLITPELVEPAAD